MLIAGTSVRLVTPRRGRCGTSPERAGRKFSLGTSASKRVREPLEVVERDSERDVCCAAFRLAVLVERLGHERNQDAVAKRYGLGLDRDQRQVLDRPRAGGDPTAVANEPDWLVAKTFGLGKRSEAFPIPPPCVLEPAAQLDAHPYRLQNACR